MTLRTAAIAVAVAVVGLASARPAAAESHKLLVLQTEGRADAATRGRIDAAIVKLALAAEPQASPGELNFSDAATAVGCKPDAPACKDEVLAMLAVDEIVITTVAPKPGGLEITVRRVGKGGAVREATTLLATGAPPDKLDAIAPLFGIVPAAPASEPATTEHRTDEPAALPSPTASREPAPSPIATPADPDRANPPAQPRDTQRHRLELAGMAGGTGLVVLGLVLWVAASSVQGDIENAPTRTRQDLANLRDLESKGDLYAGLGNLFAISGLIVGGVSAYFYIQDRRSHDRRAGSTASARLTPAVLGHGAGLVLTIGGTP